MDNVLRTLVTLGSPYGLTEEKARTVIDKVGVTTLNLLRYIEVGDLTAEDIGIKLAPARMIVAAIQNGVPAEPAPTIAAEAITVIVQGHKPVHEMVPSELIAIIANESDERRQDAAEEWDTRTRGNPSIVLVNSRVDTIRSLELMKTARVARHTFHGPDPVKTAKEIVSEKVLHDPIDDTVLIGGINQQTLADWSLVTEENLILVAWANSQGFLRGRDPVDIAEQVTIELNGYWSQIKARLENVERVRPGTKASILAGLKRPIGKAQTYASPPPIGALRGDGIAIRKSKHAELFELAARCMGNTELRSPVWGYNNSLPGNTASPDDVADAWATEAIRRNDVSDAHFWLKLMQLSPGRSQEIRNVAEYFGVRL